MCEIPDPPPPEDFECHRRQDYQSLLMHVEAVKRLKRNASLVGRLEETLDRWRKTVDARSLTLLEEWQRIIRAQDWCSALSTGERGAQLRQASPLSTLLDQQTRIRIIQHVSALVKARADIKRTGNDAP